MRPSAPSNNLLPIRVSQELQLVRNRMFRLDSMFKEQGNKCRDDLKKSGAGALECVCSYI